MSELRTISAHTNSQYPAFDDGECYGTSDLTLAATLSLMSIKVYKLLETKPNQFVFLFKKSDELNELVEKFWSSEIQVEPKVFATELKAIKARIFSAKTNS